MTNRVTDNGVKGKLMSSNVAISVDVQLYSAITPTPILTYIYKYYLLFQSYMSTE